MNTIPGYQIEAVLGRGRCSVVYLALERGRGRKVALKVAGSARHAAARQPVDFAREAAAVSAQAASHVIQVFNHGVSGADAYLAMEYAARGSLAGHDASFTPAAAVSFLGQAASALDRVHRQGWVHRDVKPANLLLREDGSLVLADFGCARRRGEVDPRESGTVVGTPQYAAPEQSAGAAADPAADVYSLGAVFYWMLAGEPPFPGQTPVELLAQHALAPVPRLARGLAHWQPLLDAMLAKDPGQRLPDGQAVAGELQRNEIGEPS